MILLIDGLALSIMLAWITSGMALVMHRSFRPDAELPSLPLAVFHELRPAYLPAAAIHSIMVAFGDIPFWAQAFTATMNIINWYLLRDVGGDDDRWKRRRRKLAERVAEVAGGLRVVPAGQST